MVTPYLVHPRRENAFATSPHERTVLPACTTHPLPTPYLVHHQGEDAPLHLARVLRAQDDHLRLREIEIEIEIGIEIEIRSVGDRDEYQIRK